VSGIDLDDLALRLDAEEKFRLRYRWPARALSDGTIEYEERVDPLLDVAEDRGILFVSQAGQVMKVHLDEAIEVLPG